MRYFFISDLHGCEPSIVDNALKEKGFDPKNDTLVVLGDIVDRGHYVRQLLKYLMNIPHLIQIKGNHDIRVYELLLGKDWPQAYDIYNGVGCTFASLLGWAPDACTEDHLFIANHLIEEGNNTELSRNLADFYCYMRGAAWGIEFPDLIAVHGWLPVNRSDEIIPPSEATPQQWADATWSNTEKHILLNHLPDKKILVGHWHAWRLRVRFEMDKNPSLYFKEINDVSTIDYSTYETANYIAIDACTTISNKVNVYIYESDAEPLMYTSNGVVPFSKWRR